MFNSTNILKYGDCRIKQKFKPRKIRKSFKIEILQNLCTKKIPVLYHYGIQNCAVQVSADSRNARRGLGVAPGHG